MIKVILEQNSPTQFRVGQAMASTEEKAYEIMKELDVDYVLVIFGGLSGYSSDGNCFEAIFQFPYYRYQQVHVDGAYRRQHP